MISVTQTDVEIHPRLAGIGDIVLQKNSGNVQTTLSDIKILKGSTYSGGVSGYHIYGVIYGFEKGCAMVMARVETAKKWADNADGNLGSSEYAGAIISATDISSQGKLRNGKNAQSWGCCMNVAECKSSLASSTGTEVHPNSANSGHNQAMSLTTFNGTSDNAVKARKLCGTYEAYLRQTMPMGNGGAGVFDLKYHVGKDNTRILAQYDSTTNRDDQSRWYPAAAYCYNYYPTGGTSRVGEWWLPDMVELRQMMKDETNDLINVALAKCGTKCSHSAYRWSSVRASATNAWYFSTDGVSRNYHFYNGFAARPITLLKLY